MTTDRPASYRIFLLTFWLEEVGDLVDSETWRFRLEGPRTAGDRRLPMERLRWWQYRPSLLW